MMCNSNRERTTAGRPHRDTGTERIRMKDDLAGVPPAAGRVEELREVLTNLVFNAVDALLQGATITLRGRSSPPAPEAPPVGW
jgi:signal transduction histidine kinase